MYLKKLAEKLVKSYNMINVLIELKLFDKINW